MASLAAVAILTPYVIRPRHSGSLLGACGSNLRNLGTALELYANDWQGEYPAALTRMAPEIIRLVPPCPVSQQPYRYWRTPRRRGYLVYCSGLHHTANGVTEPNYPQYTPRKGLSSRW